MSEPGKLFRRPTHSANQHVFCGLACGTERDDSARNMGLRIKWWDAMYTVIFRVIWRCLCVRYIYYLPKTIFPLDLKSFIYITLNPSKPSPESNPIPFLPQEHIER